MIEFQIISHKIRSRQYHSNREQNNRNRSFFLPHIHMSFVLLKKNVCAVHGNFAHTHFFHIALFIALFIEFPRTIPLIASTISFLSLLLLWLFCLSSSTKRCNSSDLKEEEKKTNSHKFRFVTSENQRFNPL